MPNRLAVLLIAVPVFLTGCSFFRDLGENIRDAGRQIGEALGLCCDVEKRVEGPPVRLQWQGPFRAVDLAVLPERGDQRGTGIIADRETWALVWQAFRPSEKLPVVDFTREFVVFARNLTNVGTIELVHVAVGGNSMDLGWRIPAPGRAITTHVQIAFAVLRRGPFGLVRSSGHALVLPPPEKAAPSGGGKARRRQAAQMHRVGRIRNPNIEFIPSRKVP